jgi:hypothetical protein
MKLGEAMYAQDGGLADEGVTATADDGVVDAEFEEVDDRQEERVSHTLAESPGAPLARRQRGLLL